MVPARPNDSPRRYADVNAVAAGLLRDLAFAQTSQQKTFGYKRAAAAVLGLEEPLTNLVQQDGTLPRIPGIGPASTRVILEVLDTGCPKPSSRRWHAEEIMISVVGDGLQAVPRAGLTSLRASRYGRPP
jgi:hypothetical protein